MARTIHLAPHDPLPDEDHSHVLVMRRFAEEDPSRTEIEVSRAHGGHKRDGVAVAGATWDRVVAEAGEIAEREGLQRVYVIDRTAGVREQSVLSHYGDHTADMDTLVDTDPEDGEPGPDMRPG